MKKFTIYRHTAEAKPDFRDWWAGKACEADYDMEYVKAEFDSLEEAQEAFKKYEAGVTGAQLAHNLTEIEEFSLWVEDDKAETCEMLDARYYEAQEAVTRTFKVYGADGHRQRESFCDSYRHDFSEGGKVRILEVENFDKTGTHEYTIVKITRNTAEECIDEIAGQVSDGIFENSKVGEVAEVMKDDTEVTLELFR